MSLDDAPWALASTTTFAVWVGRNQPFHLGHLAVTRKSLNVFSNPHVIGLVCQDIVPTARSRSGKHHVAYNPFSPWERYALASMTLAAAGLNSRVQVLFVPRSDETGAAIRPYLPPRFFRCTTDKDSADLKKAALWRQQGFEVEVLRLLDLEPVSSSLIRRELLAGNDWREYLHEAVHEFFIEIDGPRRLLESARVVHDLDQKREIQL